jgi:peptidoglycan/xylan/chitin deacetylase (PgdA/CDA1 family)
MPRLILLYHRIGVTDTDPWSISVSPAHFEEQMAVLRRDFLPVTLGEVADRRNGDSADTVAVTFDDGYADALHVAVPILERYRVPATFFIVSGMLEGAAEMWWDEMAHLLLAAGELPERLDLLIDGAALTWDLGESACLSPSEVVAARHWRAWDDAPTARHALYAAVWSRCQRLARSPIEDVVRQLRMWAGTGDAARDSHRLLSRDEVQRLASASVAEIGGHTVDHPVLSALHRRDQQHQIEQSVWDLQQLTGAPVTSFAYPFGKASDYTRDTIDLLRAAGITRACSNFRGLVRHDTDVHELPRLFVEDWDGATFTTIVQSLLVEERV